MSITRLGLVAAALAAGAATMERPRVHRADDLLDDDGAGFKDRAGFYGSPRLAPRKNRADPKKKAARKRQRKARAITRAMS